MNEITPCLWFDTEAEEAATFYTSVFPSSKILDVARYGSAGPRPEGMVMTVSFELDGKKFLALNGGPEFTFNEAISFMVSCKTQDEVDAFWTKLTEGGEEGPCGWLKDKFGVSWQIVPTALPELLTAARNKSLSEDRSWIRLGHWRKRLLGGWQSEADGPGLFLSPQGKRDFKPDTGVRIGGSG